MKIPFIKLQENVKIPEYMHAHDVGADVYMNKTMSLKKGENIIPLGFSAPIPPGVAAFLSLRSSWMSKGLICNFTPIDPEYEGEYHLLVYNVTDHEILVEEGERICQICLFSGILQAEFCDPNTLIHRSSNCLGSSGK